MLEVNHLEKKIPDSRFGLSDITFHIPKGYICGLIGENGSGKTTLMRVLMGLYNASGEIIIDGYNMNEHEAKIKDEIGVVFDEGFFEDAMNLEQIGIFYGELYSRFHMDTYLNNLITFNLDKKMKYGKLSKGTKIKAQLAFAISHEAKLFLFDEPTAGLDKHFREEFRRICVDLVADGECSILMSSHITEDLDRIADYIAYIQDGKVLFCLPKEKLCDQFYIVIGEDYKCNLIAKEALVYKDKGTYSSSAMVINRKRFQIDDTLEKRIPSIREFMYYFVKGGSSNAEIIAEKYLKE